ncbi:hypothetical protein Lal_00032432 [Lupinus albus]|nr:hypothetical protein Lal_00032432 [Lupinus albus]
MQTQHDIKGMKFIKKEQHKHGLIKQSGHEEQYKHKVKSPVHEDSKQTAKTTIKKGWKNIWLECDSTLVVDIFKGRRVVPWRLVNSWLRCMHGISSMRFIVTHIFREGNACADRLTAFGVTSKVDKPNSWVWRLEKSKQYSVRSAYKTLTHQDALETLPHQHIQILWRTRAPLKIESRLRMLYLGGESLRSPALVFYDPSATTTMNLLITSSLLATSPTINDLIFNNVSPPSRQILDSARVKSWLWIKGQMGMDSATLFSDWIAHPLLCLNIAL